MDPLTVTLRDQIAAPRGEIPVGTSMQSNQWAISANGSYVLVMQTDGNLVLYQVAGPPPVANSSFQGFPYWSSGTNIGVAARFEVQTDGNLVIYDGSDLLWAAYNTNNASPGYLAVQVDANLVFYDTSGAAFWATNTAVDIPALMPRLENGATGRFDFFNVSAWHSLNNEGDNGATPTVTMNSSTLLVQGGFQWEHFPIGSGEGSISIEVALSGAVTCVVTASVIGAPFSEIGFSASGTWQATLGDEPVLTCSLDNGWGVNITNFKGGGSWYPGIEIDFSDNQSLCFENMSGDTASVGVAAGARQSGPRQKESRMEARNG
ncbi:hypothetical protein [Rhizobium sp. R339]|uniref:hypothetical protein n=1 Tax=Rhizobium sp. R339 TaxID=1764273 RepID=UPI00167C68D1|nr:hypothetical protein [Rhizobium sp. R339]